MFSFSTTSSAEDVTTTTTKFLEVLKRPEVSKDKDEDDIDFEGGSTSGCDSPRSYRARTGDGDDGVENLCILIYVYM